MSAAAPRPYYAVIFSSQRTPDDSGYDETARRMEELAASQPGFLGLESVRDASGQGITVSYWRDQQSIRAWRDEAEHRLAQAQGRGRWYAEFRIRICLVEDERSFARQAAMPTCPTVPKNESE